MIMRVTEEELEFEDDALIYNGGLFTGVVFSTYSNGTLREEHSYVNGFLEGKCKEWHENGQLSKEWTQCSGNNSMLISQWYENSTCKSRGTYEHGVELNYIEWDKNGHLIEERELEVGSNLHQYLEKMRKLSAR
ncbi:hypothetical protein CW749_02690 [Vibrio sp. vnigr-6D03]|nr:hypothetical protein CW749_02690 [Vibrio sp. vnigr-6D03]